MFKVIVDPPQQLLTIQYAQQVDAAQMEQCMEEIKTALDLLHPDFQLLTDLTGLERMAPDCSVHIKDIMALCDEKKVRTVMRVIPDPAKDIGFTIMSRFHYRRSLKVLTFQNLADAMAAIEPLAHESGG